jgi:hypothetical protein
MHEHGPPAGPAWAAALEASGFARSMRDSLALYPAVEILHIVGFALLFGAIVTYDLRLVVGREPPAIAQRAAAVGLALAVPAGLMLFTVEATAYLHNPVFVAKLALIALALANVGFFHFARTAGRAAGAASLALWLGVLVCGRLIAYV